MSGTLNVFWGTKPAARLRRLDKGVFEFQYLQEWLSDPQAVPFSVRLPLKAEPFDDEACRTFFTNLLPEGATRALIARKLGISESNDFGLLAALGGECAGAISLLPENLPPSDQGGYEPLSPEEIGRMIEQMSQNPLLVSREDLRLSLAGAQQKLPVFFQDGKLYLPHGSFPSSHILKPEVPGFAGIIENEAFCMGLARECGLPVPDAAILRLAHPVYLVERYDRGRDEHGNLIRLHQEDFCQALGRSHGRKYEADGGPNLQKCFSLVAEHGTQPALDKKTMLEWVVFNHLVGNCDAHAKNLSMLISKAEYRLAPLYDLLSTRVYPALSVKFAMPIGGQSRAEWVTKSHWERLAREAGVGAKAVLGICAEMGEKVPALAARSAEEFHARHGGSQVIDKIVKHIGSGRKPI